ncbi:uncharacterized protein JCM6883_004816, partial [Sporobolomyces salmoneus]|uniref:uncharacterized protein n=1 Tax=Sporobolomyces salmoneus TaxID=183962 RepID=UPI00316B8FD5
MTMKLYPTSNPVHLRDYPIEAGQDRMLNFDSSSSSSSNKFVQYVEASAEASRLFPPLAEEERPPTFQFRQPVVNNNVAEGNESNARHRPPAASSSVSASATSSGSNSKGRVPSHGQKLRAKKHKPEWKDLPYSNDFSIESQFLHFPASVLDQILSDVSLNLRDHLSLAASCRSLRACYYSPSYSSLWRALVALRPPVEQGRLNVKKSTSSSRENERLVRRIWSNGLKVDTEQMQVIQVKEGGGGGAVARPPTDESAAIAIRSKEWDNAIDLVHTIVSSL